jgi:hypothetical protein
MLSWGPHTFHHMPAPDATGVCGEPFHFSARRPTQGPRPLEYGPVLPEFLYWIRLLHRRAAL